MGISIRLPRLLRRWPISLSKVPPIYPGITNKERAGEEESERKITRRLWFLPLVTVSPSPSRPTLKSPFPSLSTATRPCPSACDSSRHSQIARLFFYRRDDSGIFGFASLSTPILPPSNISVKLIRSGHFWTELIFTSSPLVSTLEAKNKPELRLVLRHNPHPPSSLPPR